MSTDDKRDRKRSFDSAELQRVLGLYEKITARLKAVIDDMERAGAKDPLTVDGGERLFDVADQALNICGKLQSESDKAIVAAERNRKSATERVTENGPRNRNPVAKSPKSPKRRSSSPS
jgi:hypothetical protein